MYSLEGIRLKVMRGYEHMQEVSQLIESFREEQPYSVRVDMDPETGDRVFKVDGIVREVPPRFSAIIGDAVYNFRSALDHLAWQLVIANGQTPVERLTAFPICTKPAQWDRAKGKLKGMSDTARALVESEQPCYNRHPYRKQNFTFLEELSNVDKHRHLNLVQTATLGGFFSRGLPITAQSDVFIHEGPIERDTILARFPKTYAQVHFYPVIDVAFGQGTSAAGEPVFNTLLDFGFLIEDTVKMFFSAEPWPDCSPFLR